MKIHRKIPEEAGKEARSCRERYPLPMKTTSATNFIGTPISQSAGGGRVGARNLFRFIVGFARAGVAVCIRAVVGVVMNRGDHPKSADKAVRARAPEKAGRQNGGSLFPCGEELWGIEP